MHRQGPRRTAIIVVAWNHLESTTRPCLESIAWTTHEDHVVVCVDNASDDETPTWLARRARTEANLRIVTADSNRGWHGGVTLGLEALDAGVSHIALVNSDVIVSEWWLCRLLATLDRHDGLDCVIPCEGTDVDESLPKIGAVNERAALVARLHEGTSEACVPSGFCCLMPRDREPILREWLGIWPRAHAGEIDGVSWLEHRGVRCRRALDTWVFHTRGGSGGFGPPRAPGART